MTKTIFSEHMTKDRVDRYVFIATKIGFGEVVHTAKTKTTKGEGKVEITSTGVIIVRGYNNIVITMYVATVAQIKMYYKNGVAPRDVILAAKRNEKKNYIVLQNKAQARAR